MEGSKWRRVLQQSNHEWCQVIMPVQYTFINMIGCYLSTGSQAAGELANDCET